VRTFVAKCRYLTILLIAVLANACGNDITAPAALPLPGHWVGTLTVTSCTGGVDFRACPRLPRAGSVVLDVEQAGSAVSGLLTLDVPNPGVQSSGSLRSAGVPVTGSISPSQELHLSGSASMQQTQFGVETVTVSDWASTATNRNMTGTLRVVTSGFYFGFGFPQTFTVHDTVTLTTRAARRTDVSDSR
jgi:hypothetical protein